MNAARGISKEPLARIVAMEERKRRRAARRKCVVLCVVVLCVYVGASHGVVAARSLPGSDDGSKANKTR